MQRLLRALIIGFAFFPLVSFGYYQYDYDSEVDSSSYQHQNEYDPYYSRFSYEEDAAFNANYADNNYDYDDHNYYDRYDNTRHYVSASRSAKKSTVRSRLPNTISPPGERVVVVDPRVHRWGAYNAQGNLIREGMTSAGSNWCKDLRRSCRTSVGTFRILSLGDRSCFSRKFPLGRGGAPMPYCMFFNRTQALHGSNQVAEANLSHGCVRLKVSDAEWLRYNFVRIGTKVIIKPY